MIIGNTTFDEDKTYVCGILNVTPDSFSDGGKFNKLDAALYHAEEMIEEGAMLIDIGGESTRPGYTMISDEEEIERVVPVIEALKSRFDVPLSLDTYKSKVAKAGIESGIDLINDIWGLKYDKAMAKVVADSGLPICIMHNRDNTDYTDFMTDVVSDLKESVDMAITAGIERDKLILDPGVGFAKNLEQNIIVMKELERLNCFKLPILLGTSRKSVIGLTLDLPKDERVEGTLVTTVLAVIKGCMFVRVHDVKENIRTIKMAEALFK
ncbi:MAG: dihydropteroate synthase [Lachnospiraceae bacterium]|nr:dihydropteroate synthase [Lachnospiraceae bacterium]MDY5000476.1 dihydropteroate synthase [Lachnospiraceae bacterium]